MSKNINDLLSFITDEKFKPKVYRYLIYNQGNTKTLAIGEYDIHQPIFRLPNVREDYVHVHLETPKGVRTLRHYSLTRETANIELSELDSIIERQEEEVRKMFTLDLDLKPETTFETPPGTAGYVIDKDIKVTVRDGYIPEIKTFESP